MKIRMRMTAGKAAQLGYAARHELAVGEVEVDKSKLSDTAAWIAQNVTATYTLDEYTDRIPVKAVCMDSMEDRDRKNGKSESYIASYARSYGEEYTGKMELFPITFPVYGKSYDAPERVFEDVVKQLKNSRTEYLENITTKERFYL